MTTVSATTTMRTKLSSKLGTIIAVAAAASSLLAACVSAAPLGSDGSDVSESKLQQRAAFALRVSPDAVTVSHQNREGIRINFVATIDKHVKYCYVTSADGDMSDAICSDTEAPRAETPKVSTTHTDAAPKNISQIQ